MARQSPNYRNRNEDRRSAHPNKGSGKESGKGLSAGSGKRLGSQSQPSISKGRYDAPGDEPIAITSRLILQEAFKIERGLVSRLERREINPKEAFTIRDSSNSYYRASLKEMNEEGGLAVPYERMERSPEPIIDITLACSVLARQRMIFVMQKATELGVTSIVPLLTDHSVPLNGLEHERANSWPAQVIRAAKQCRRGSLPNLLPPTSLDNFLASRACMDADECVVLDDRSDPTLASTDTPRRVVLFVGPEGGFSDVERTKLQDKTRPWFLGGRILRAETAVIVGLTAVPNAVGRFSGLAFHPMLGEWRPLLEMV